jgi:DNA polymerase III alpha subunit (gram-positive type)
MIDSYVIYVIDTETTGLSAVDNDIVEISMARLICNDDGVYQDFDQKSWLLKAMNPKTIQDEALAVNGHKREDILCLSKYGKENYKMPVDVVNDIEMWMMDDNVSAVDRIWAGQNPYFDIDACKELWKRCGKEGEFPFEIGNGNRVVDTKQIVALYDLCTGKRRKYYGLGQLIKACKVKKEKAHRADADVRMTKDLLLFLINIIKPTVMKEFSDCYTDGNEE